MNKMNKRRRASEIQLVCHLLSWVSMRWVYLVCENVWKIHSYDVYTFSSARKRQNKQVEKVKEAGGREKLKNHNLYKEKNPFSPTSLAAVVVVPGPTYLQGYYKCLPLQALNAIHHFHPFNKVWFGWNKNSNSKLKMSTFHRLIPT